MGEIRAVPRVNLITAVCYSSSCNIDNILDLLQERYGSIDIKSEVFQFKHTLYYEQEMGSELKKLFCSFENLIEHMDIVDIKRHTNDIEDSFAKDKHRIVNLDPGYVEMAKLILATTKNYSHRIYLGKGIYGDVQLFWRHGYYQENPWTYPDYKEKATKEFFSKVRTSYTTKGVK